MIKLFTFGWLAYHGRYNKSSEHFDPDAVGVFHAERTINTFYKGSDGAWYAESKWFVYRLIRDKNSLKKALKNMIKLKKTV